jgi:hypothetical protein
MRHLASRQVLLCLSNMYDELAQSHDGSAAAVAHLTEGDETFQPAGFSRQITAERMLR